MDVDQSRPVLDTEPADDGATRNPRLLTPAIAAALVLLVASAAAAMSFVAATGGLQLPGALPTDMAVASPVPADPTATPAPAVTPTPTPDPGPTATPEPTRSPVATAVASPTPAATSDRYQFLEPCPSRPDCYLYAVRLGDNLRSIANYFGVPYSTILSLNPTITDPASIQPGDVIVLPPPTR